MCCRLPVLVLLLQLAACTYGPVKESGRVQNIALSADGNLAGIIVKYERFRDAVGVNAFPNGGVPQILEQRADVYIVDIPGGEISYEASLPAPEDRQVSFNPWLIGWRGSDLYFQVTGCQGKPGDECYGDLIGQTFYRVSPGGISQTTRPPELLLISSHRKDSEFLSLGSESSGVSIRRSISVRAVPLLRFSENHKLVAFDHF